MPSEFDRWFENAEAVAPQGVPRVEELLCSLDLDAARGYRLFPADKPVCFVKHGLLRWNEVLAQHMAQRSLAAMGAAVRAPTVYYAFRYGHTIVIVMEYVRGQTVQEALKQSTLPRAEIAEMVAGAINALARIPIQGPVWPSAIDRSLARHPIFDPVAPRLYENAGQLEAHINLFLQIAMRRRKPSPPTVRFSGEPLVYCYSDVFPANFIIHNKQIVVVDFDYASFLPASFALFAVRHSRFDLDMIRSILKLVDIPGASEENVDVLAGFNGLMTIGSGFVSMRLRIEGGDPETQARLASHIQT